MSLSESPQFQPNLDTSVAVLGKDESSPKAKEREERFRMARERQREEQRRKLEELRESIERAEEFRRKQEENRRQKIEEMRRRDEQHRASVEERRKKLLDEENERKQAILRKTEAKLEQTKQKKISGTSVALFSSCSGALNATHTTPLGASDFRSTRNLESAPYENSVPAGFRKSTIMVRRKRLSSSVDQIARIRATISENQSNKQEVESSSAAGSVENGSASPTVNNRVKTMGSMRKSRADLRRTTESLQPVVNGKATPAEQTRNLVSARTGISKSVSSSEALGGNAAMKSAAKSPAFPRASVLTAKFGKGPPMFSTPPAKLPLSPTKTLAPRSLPKPLKDTSSQRSLTSNKGIVKAVHDLSIQIQPLQLDKMKELPPTDANQKQKGVSATGEPSSAETSDKTIKNSVEEEYKVKLAEKRRLAREKAEREAEEERLRAEEERRKEEERLQFEEEEQRRHEEEELRAVEEARKQEEERFRLAVEEAEQQRREEEEKNEAERQEKLAAETKAQEEAEKREKEREEKFRREEEERQERKKRIEVIMKRVKTDDSSHSQKDVKELKATEPAGGDDSGTKFVSPLLRQIMGSKLRGKASVGGSSPATPEPGNDESKTLNIEASSEAIDATKVNLDELLDEKSEVSPALSLNLLQSQPSIEETVSTDSETINEGEPSLPASQYTNSDEESGTDSCSPTTTSPSNDEAVSDATQSNLEVIHLPPPDSKVTEASDDNQNWSIAAKHHSEANTIIPEQSLPDLPRIAFDESSVKHSQNKLPDILL